MEIGRPPPPTASARPPRRLVLCCDGSWQTSNHGLKNIASNVAKLSRAIGNYGIGPTGDIIQQIVYYDAGVGTGTSAANSEGNWMAAIQKSWEGGFGRGLEENVCEAYNFIVNNWLPGDEIYIFGFSRGAYTARALAGMICNMGICFPDMMDDWWAVYAEYKERNKKKKEEPVKKPMPPSNGVGELKAQLNSITTFGKYAQEKVEFRNHFWKNVPIQVVGVFDTVGALGLPNNNLINFKRWNEAQYGFHDTNVHPQIKFAFHALALDEHRKAFEPTLWHQPKDNTTTKLIQCWFPGYHINVGGGSENTEKHYGDLESMANLSLAWMIDQVRRYTDLEFEDYALTRLYQNYVCTVLDLSRRSFKKGDSGYHYSYGKTDTQAASGVADPENITAYGGWGMGYRPDSMDWVMRAAGSSVRTPGQYKQEKKDDLEELGIKRPAKTNEFIHPVVAYAMGKAYVEANGNAPLKYQPSALDGFERVKDSEDPYNPNDVYMGIWWRKEVDADETQPSYVKRGWDYAKSFIWTPPQQAKKFIYIQEMPLWWDTPSNFMNEKDYMRADWLAFRAPRLGFDDFVEKEIPAYLEKVPDTYVATPREERLLELLKGAADKASSSIWKEKSLVYSLRARPSPGYETEKSERMQATGERTRKFLDDLDEGRL
ncbi:hypothetical protein BO71DRAFT_442360 [Aspergillus ellipticus CBS 707.79]|uniref:T6SS Phospholipase effector Tle1-like catalytic domain-containing protein n=1 Tax=Aspergillus ellipticus CBS 707.79 TaxID=1448320 RepID=A0A319D5V0_9EURO|nr:hypothetical protein BO71DRAFT_442360 [Aspergillus ellipticus CBS 707.79]